MQMIVIPCTQVVPMDWGFRQASQPLPGVLSDIGSLMQVTRVILRDVITGYGREQSVDTFPSRVLYTN